MSSRRVNRKDETALKIPCHIESLCQFGVVDTLAALTRFRVELGHLEGPVLLYERCSSGRLATYWTRDLEEHIVRTPAG